MYAKGLKRLFDVVLALVGVIVLSPVILLVAIAIRIGDPGPVIFRQERIGAGGRVFMINKFRSMPVGTANLSSDLMVEPRLTWIGRFIRRTNLDELPQLWNILIGDMSVVGPRPPIPSQTELIALRRENGALQCRPGLTGWAQVNGYDGMSVPVKAGYDAEYARRISFLMDLRIMLRTCGYLTRPPPKY